MLGDSKSYTGGNSWPATLTTNLNTATSPTTTWAQDNDARAAQTASGEAAVLASDLAAQPANHIAVLFNLGVNDFVGGVEATWIADVQAIADACHVRWPSATFYLMRPWKRSFNATADTYAGWINTVVGSRTFCALGPDERVWLKGADDGAAMTTDGIHYSAAGEAECAAQWKTVLGY